MVADRADRLPPSTLDLRTLSRTDIAPRPTKTHYLDLCAVSALLSQINNVLVETTPITLNGSGCDGNASRVTAHKSQPSSASFALNTVVLFQLARETCSEHVRRRYRTRGSVSSLFSGPECKGSCPLDGLQRL